MSSQTADTVATTSLVCSAVRCNKLLLLIVFLISPVHHHHPALLHRHALILDHLLMFLLAFSAVILKLLFSQSLPSIAVLSLPQADLLEL